MFSMFKQQRDAAVGKDDVGIAANGLKVFFALSNYYNNVYKDDTLSGDYLRTSNYLFSKDLYIPFKEYNAETKKGCPKCIPFSFSRNGLRRNRYRQGIAYTCHT